MSVYLHCQASSRQHYPGCMPWLACEGEWISSWAFALSVEIPMDPEAKSIAGGLQCCKLATTGSGWVSFPSEEPADKVAYCMQG